MDSTLEVREHAALAPGLLRHDPRGRGRPPYNTPCGAPRVIAVRTVAFVRLCCCAVRASKQRAAGTKGGAWRTHRSATRGWRFEAVARGLWAVRTSLLPRPRCVTSARHPFGASACGVRLRGRVSSRLRARSSWPFVAVYRSSPSTYSSRNFPKRYPLRRYAPGTLARIRTHLRIPRPIPKRIRAPAGAAYTHPSSNDPTSHVYAPTCARIRPRVCVNPHGAYTHPPPHLYAYAQTRRAVRIHAPAYAPDAAYTPERNERHVTTCARDRGRRE